MVSFTQFHGHLELTFGSHSKLGKISSWATSIVTTSSETSWASWDPRLLKNSWQRQNTIEQQTSKISSLEAQNRKLTQLLWPNFLVNTITQAVASSLNISGSNKPQNTNNGMSAYTSKPYLESPAPHNLLQG